MNGKRIRILPAKRISGEIEVPGDKSISHRAVILGSIAQGKTRIRNFLKGADCLSTVAVFRQLGVAIEERGEEWIVHGKGAEGLREPLHVLQCGNSGTTTRLVLGILASRPFTACLDGDDSIARRPMLRVVEPLREMGARIWGRGNGQYTPLMVQGGDLKGIRFVPKVASAQVKSAVLLAGLFAEGKTTVAEKVKSRDHTERMLRFFGASIEETEDGIAVQGGQRLEGGDIFVPGDISSAAFFLALAAAHPQGAITVRNVGVNPTRTGILDVLEQMGAAIKLENQRLEAGEPVADLTVTGGRLKGIEIGGAMIPRLIDEIPVLAAIATQAEGRTVIKDAAELKVKETNRIAAMVTELRKMGARIEALEDGMVIEGPVPLKGAEVEVYGDHRVAMALSVAGLLAAGDRETVISDPEAVAISFPQFYDLLQQVVQPQHFLKI